MHVLILLVGTTLSVSSGYSSGYGQNPFFTNVLVRIDTTEGDVRLPRNVEILGGTPGEWIDVILPQNRLSELSQAHLKYSILIEDVDSYSQSFAGQYHTLAQIEQILEAQIPKF